MSEFESISLKEFLTIKYLERPYHLFGWRFELDPYSVYSPNAPRGFWVDRTGEPKDGRVVVSLRWCRVARWPHCAKRKAAWRARFKDAEDT